MPRYMHLKWQACAPGHVVAGIWFQAPRVFPNKNGVGSIALGEVEHDDGTRTGFTLTTMLRQQLDGTPLGSRVRITYLGTQKTSNGYDLMRFAVKVEPPTPQTDIEATEEAWR